ncbi:CRISPR-associated exonuclease Cas4 [Inhella inkyongensis]|uniref:CRISPR-associated exonuclease Cas4 n=1 Tax=Inhella inkyongensis TaxID=392593 RepID=A0A840RYB3_9BURK|nr:CRISPR-associated protein Cas4 [Inhella inkyongensis]MBB5202945.1 CRISPR-associated exonuclease Cas4 [Inhella inkyongensis]
MEAELIPLSALQHWAYCPRQCALIHLEQAFDDNLHTLRGNALHARVDQPSHRQEQGLRVERALPLWHDELGLIGKADAVEFGPDGSACPVEYKQGSRNKAAEIAACDELQLAAQALCLEAMTGRPVPLGALFYASSKRRRAVAITAELRERVRQAAQAVRAMLAAGQLPSPLEGAAAQQRCKACSLKARCQPEAASCAALRQARQALFDPDALL